MAIFYFHCGRISRKSGKSAVSAAAYNAGAKLHDDERGRDYSYTSKDEVVYSTLRLPANAPEQFQDRERLWNAVQEQESKANSCMARNFKIALPNELNRWQCKELVDDFAERLAQEGMCVDASIHWVDKDDEHECDNHHVHVMTTTRSFKENGEWDKKESSQYKLDEDGNKIPVIDTRTGEQKYRERPGKGRELMWEREKIKTNDWDSKEACTRWKAAWAELSNRELERAGHDERIDHRSYEEQGLDILPQVHEGYAARAIEKNGGVADVCEYNREVREANDQIRAINSEIAEASKELEAVQKETSRLRQMIDNIKNQISNLRARLLNNNWNNIKEQKEEKINARIAKLQHRGTAGYAGGTAGYDRSTSKGKQPTQEADRGDYWRKSDGAERSLAERIENAKRRSEAQHRSNQEPVRGTAGAREDHAFRSR